MPRTARIKNPAGLYHIIIRSISEIDLFKTSEDKEFYLSLIKKYQKVFRFKIYSYCLMTNHGHFAIDCCGADISKIMKAINQSYSSYFNRSYNRHGHLFQDRFKSRLVKDDIDLINLSAYIHNNPKDILEFRDIVHKYTYSSLGIYLGIAEDKFGILDTNMILQNFSENKSRARKSYLEYINRLSSAVQEIDMEFKNDDSKVISERKILIRNFNHQDLVKSIAKYTDVSFNLHIKFNHKNTELRALCVLIMRSLCNLGFKDICGILGNITISNVSRLCEKGYRLVTTDYRYLTLIDDLITQYSAA